MANLDSIFIDPKTLTDILKQLQAKNHTGVVAIIDCVYSFTIRDIDGMFITDIKKEEEPINE